MPAFSPIIGIA